MIDADFRVGDVAVYGGLTISPEDIDVFAESIGFDGASSVAARWLGVALQLRMIVDGLFRKRASQGAPGLESVEWHVPPQPGDTLRVRHEILEVRSSRSRPEIDLIRFRFETLNQRRECVQSVHQWVMFRRGSGASGFAPMTSDTTKSAGLTDSHHIRYVPPSDAASLIRTTHTWDGWERATVGMTATLGTHRFEATDIVAFARAFDPQPFHLSEAAARGTVFGKLCASGLHTVVAWAALAQDERWAVHPTGFRNLKWHRPVFVGETIQYRSTVTELVPDAQRSDLMWVNRLNQGFVTEGNLVIELEDRVAVLR